MNNKNVSVLNSACFSMVFYYGQHRCACIVFLLDIHKQSVWISVDISERFIKIKRFIIKFCARP